MVDLMRPARGPALAAYQLALELARPGLVRWTSDRARRGLEDPARLPERFGRPTLPRPDGPLLWLHAASRGETAAALALAASLRNSHDTPVLLTTFTRAGAQLAASAPVLHQYLPFDARPWVRGFLDHWRPSAAVFVISELWPTLIHECQRRSIPMALVSGSLSPTSQRRWARAARLGLRPFAALGHVSSPDPEHRARLATLCAAPVLAGVDLKRVVSAPPPDPTLVAALRAAAAGRPIIAIACLHPAELEPLRPALRALAALRPPPLVVIAPRHPERTPELLARLGGPPAPRRSRGELPGPGDPLYWLDTLGELGSLYAAASIAFIGGSLAPLGGHNPTEAARLGCALVTGPHQLNHGLAVAALAQGGALLQASSNELADALIDLARDPEAARARGERARAIAWTPQPRDEALLQWLGEAALP